MEFYREQENGSKEKNVWTQDVSADGNFLMWDSELKSQGVDWIAIANFLRKSEATLDGPVWQASEF